MLNSHAWQLFLFFLSSFSVIRVCDMDLMTLDKFVKNIDSFLSARLLNILAEKFSDDKIKGKLL